MVYCFLLLFHNILDTPFLRLIYISLVFFFASYPCAKLCNFNPFTPLSYEGVKHNARYKQAQWFLDQTWDPKRAINNTVSRWIRSRP